jgi:hypothetical protein
MLMHSKEPIVTGDGAVISFNGKYTLITNPEDGTTDDGHLTRAELTRLMTAAHELAHALAAVSIGCKIRDMRITSRSGRTFRDGLWDNQLGYVDALHTHTPEQGFFSLAGWAWEIRYGIPCRAASDYEEARRRLTCPATVRLYGDRWEELQQKAGEFVERHKDFVLHYSIELADDIARDDGKLGKKALAKVNDDLRRYLASEISYRL